VSQKKASRAELLRRLVGKTIKGVRFTNGDGCSVDLQFTDGSMFVFLIDIRPEADAVFYKNENDEGSALHLRSDP
jgi:hypothetical protein